MIRWMGGLGQSSDPELPSYHPDGLPLIPGEVELITEASVRPGWRHDHLADHVGEIAIWAWTGNPDDPETELGGTGWIRAVEWVPYQLATFVTPAFAGYISGHSTFSRAAAEVLAAQEAIREGRRGVELLPVASPVELPVASPLEPVVGAPVVGVPLVDPPVEPPVVDAVVPVEDPDPLDASLLAVEPVVALSDGSGATQAIAAATASTRAWRLLG